MADDSTPSAAQIYQQALAARRERRLGEAVALYRAALMHPEGGLSRKQRRWAYVQCLKCLTRLGMWDKAEKLARNAALKFPKLAYAHQCRGEALIQLGRISEAEAELRRALEVDPEQDGARALLQALRVPPKRAGRRARPRSWPTRQAAFDDPRELIRRYLLRDRPRAAFIAPGTVFATLGSCFADNLAHRLRAAGYSAFSERIGEEVNSTHANRYLIEWVENGPVDAQTAIMNEAFGAASRERLKRAIQGCDVFVMTLGVAASFFDDRGEFVFIPQDARTTAAALDHAAMRTTSVAENVENIGCIIDAVRRLAGPEVKVVLTVSPVPLAGTTEHDSAITADCLSKSTLRVACEEAVAARRGEGVLYWPSFEIVRWLGAHFGPETPGPYGADDGNTRHVSEWLIDLIVALFVEFHAETAG